MRKAISIVALGCALGVGCGERGPATAPGVAPFPEKFLWGTATAPYQIEGGLHASDWWAWEQKGKVESGESSDNGPHHLEHYAADFDLAKSLGTNAYRMGIDWSRLFPTEDSFTNLQPDPAAVKVYHDLIAALRARNISVMMTLHHYVFPLYILDPDNQAAHSGFLDPAIVDKLAKFAGWAAREYGADVDYWITLNEPFILLAGGYISASIPPGLSFKWPEAFQVARNMIYAHAAAYDAIHAARPNAKVSIANHNRVFVPQEMDSAMDIRAAKRVDWVANHLFFRALTTGDLDANGNESFDDPEDVHADPKLKGRLDFLGVNYYSISQVGYLNETTPILGIPFQSNLKDGRPVSDFGMDIYPEGLGMVLDSLKQYGKPIILTENGIADANDDQRPRFLAEQLGELQRAMAGGADVIGYYYWSLFDNFEWLSGYCPRFGLYRIDFDDPARPRTEGEGARVFRQIIAARGVSPELLKKYPTYGNPVTCPASFF